MIDKSLYASGGIAELDNPPGDVLEIEIIDLDADPVEEEEESPEEAFDANLAESMSEEDLRAVSQDILEYFEADLQARREWVQTYVKGLEFLGLKYEERSKPWDGACGVYHPMLTEAVVRFQSEVITETFPAMGPVKTTIIGEETKDKLAAAARVAEDMNYRLTEEMTEYRSEHERMLWSLPIAGTAFKKVYFDPTLGRQTAIFAPAEDVVIPYGASSVDNAERVTHIIRRTKNDLKKLMVAGFYRDIDLPESSGSLDEIEKEKIDAVHSQTSITTDNRFKLLEMQIELDLKGYEDPDGIALPYVVTVEKSSGEVLSIRRNYKENDAVRLKMSHFVQYNYVPGFGAYGLGLTHLIGGYVRAATSITRQLVDSGTLANLPGGFKTRGLRINKGNDSPIGPGEWVDVDVPGNSIRDNILPLPYKEPSGTLYQLLGDIISEGKNFINASELNVSDMSGQAPVGTTLALLERQLKVMSAIQARMHFSMKQEFKLLKGIIRDCMPDNYEYDVEKADRMVKGSDYDLCEVIPVSDPNAATMAHKVIQFQTVTQMAQQAPPGTYDMKALHRQAIEVIGVKNANKLVPMDEETPNIDPVSENECLLIGKPVRSYIEQDHDAHIAVHAAILQDPSIQMWLQNNPSAGQIVAQVQAHLAAHYGMKFRKSVEEQMGISIPKPKDGEGLPPEIETAVSQMAAEATQRVLMTNQARAAQEAALKQAQDPVVQMQQQELMQKEKELQLKEREVEIKEKQMAMEAAHKADQTQIAQEKIDSQERIAGIQVGRQAATDKAKMENDQMATGLKMGVEIAKTLTQGAKKEDGSQSSTKRDSGPKGK